jgi:predicted secreted Zn-dependent protease
LQVHEAGHLQAGRDFESNFKRALLGMAPAANCGALDQAIRARFDQMRQQANQRDRDYDAQTNGGATQGARF